MKKKHNNKKLLAQLHTVLVSTKYKLKENIKEIENTHYNATGQLPANNSAYDQLRKELDYARKLLGFWYKFDL